MRLTGAAIILVLVIAVTVNLVWEMLQFPLYRCSETGRRRLRRCLLASLGDGVMVVLILIAGWIAFGTVAWFVVMDWMRLALILVTGLVLALLVELVAVHRLRRWEYGDRMPRMPGLAVGWVPILQMLVLPPLIFWIVGRILSHVTG